MNHPKEGDQVVLITDMFEFVCEGALEVYCPDGEPLAIVSSKSYDLATEGGIIHVIKKK